MAPIVHIPTNAIRDMTLRNFVVLMSFRFGSLLLKAKITLSTLAPARNGKETMRTTRYPMPLNPLAVSTEYRRKPASRNGRTARMRAL